jgi:hypothetical protein
MQLRRFILIVVAGAVGIPLIAADQSGAEKSKRVVSARIVPPGASKGTAGNPTGGGLAPSSLSKSSDSGDEAIGNVQVTYQDGTKDLWTTKGNCSLVQVAPDATVGWTAHGDPVRVNSADFMRPNPELVTCRQGKVLAKIQASMPFIEDWRFLEGGKQFALRCRGAHGPANIELHDTASGKLITTLKAYDEKLPAWAKPLKDE